MSRFIYNGNYSLFRISRWSQKRFTPVGRAARKLMGIAVVLGLNFYANEIYEIVAFLLVLLGIGLGWSFFFRAQLEAERKLPKIAAVGETMHYRISFVNHTKKVLKGLSFRENTGDPRPSFEDFMSQKEPGEDKRNAWDRKVMYHRWAWLIKKNRQAEEKDMPLPALFPNKAATVRAEIIPLQRGYLDLTGVTVSCPDPFGVFRGVVETGKAERLLVLPKRYRVPQVNLPGTRKYHSGGVALSASVGNSSEFVSLRDYRPGDPQKHIHWKSWAKTDRLIIKEYQDEFFVRHALILDTFIKNSNSESFEAAVSTAASFAFTLQTRESLLDLMFVEDQAYCFSTGRGLGSSMNLLEILACVKGKRGDDLAISNLSAMVMKHAPLLSGCICIFLSWDDERKQFIGNLKARGIPVKVLVIGDNLSMQGDDPMKNDGENFHLLKAGEIEEGLARL
ncbi:MAG: DUF58 domain-containing protein [bacterium]|nr:DUF58 domain-containing protein [bacterium]